MKTDEPNLDLERLDALEAKATPLPWPNPDDDEDFTGTPEEMEHNRRFVWALCNAYPLLSKRIKELEARNAFLEEFTPKTNLGLLEVIDSLQASIQEAVREVEALRLCVGLGPEEKIISGSSGSLVIRRHGSQINISPTDAVVTKLEEENAALEQERDEAVREKGVIQGILPGVSKELRAMENCEPIVRIRTLLGKAADQVDSIAEMYPEIASSPPREGQSGLHPATQALVYQFADAIAAKLLKSQEKYSYGVSWQNLGASWSMEDCQKELLRHIEKGDPRDVAAYCAFLWSKDMPTAPPREGREEGLIILDASDPEVMWILSLMCFQCSPIAHVLQRAGHNIETRAEAEQSAVIVWLLRKYAELGKCEDWRAKVDAELNAMRKASLPTTPTATPTTEEG